MGHHQGQPAILTSKVREREAAVTSRCDVQSAHVRGDANTYVRIHKIKLPSMHRRVHETVRGAVDQNNALWSQYKYTVSTGRVANTAVLHGTHTRGSGA